ncbi:MAG TPA: PKD domain-containing protein [Nocardioidaceae bacterium]|nr:PKD domain-containing protein [Nocardioidaceae bacterium]
MKRALAGTSVLAMILTLLAAAPAEAFKPYTHNATAQPALADVVDDGNVTIDGREYPVRPEVRDALRAWPSYYQAGVIGPDGFPDLTFGQSTIHPEQTGKWLEYLLTEAWAAQSDPAYGTAQRGQILAFAYGFLTHAAGDMWAHTFVNDFAQGIFPAVSDVVTDVDAAEVALRHVIVEGYIGDATPGYDGNPNRTTLPNGDVSNDSTPAIDFDAPTEWIYDMLVDPYATLPVGRCGDGLDDDQDGVADDGCAGNHPYIKDGAAEPVRGPLIDYFLDLQSDLQIEQAVTWADQNYDDCALVDPDCYEKTATVRVNTVRGHRTTTYQRNECIGATIGCLPDPGDLADDLSLKLIVGNYLDAWIDDIEDGLQEWGRLGLATTRGLFDPQALRDTQNDSCRHLGSETSPIRISCEDGVGAKDVVFHELDPFINNHLISMLGAPDVVGDAREVLQAFSGFLDDVMGPALNPLRLVTAEIKEVAMDLVLEQVNAALGVDVEVLSSFLKHPTYWLDVEEVSLDLGPLGTVAVQLFEEGEHARLDELLNLPADHHTDTEIKLPDGSTQTSSALADNAVFEDLAIFDNAVTTAKLLMLDADGLNQVAGDLLADAGVVNAATAVATYTDHGNRPANIMVDGLGGVNWLTTIDGDHVWRENGLPRFGPEEDPEDPHGGAGTFPLWESCVLRPAFRTLYDDWETDPAWWPKLEDYPSTGTNFPDLGDGTSADPSDTAAPDASTTVAGGPVYVAPDGTRYVGQGSSLTVTATDDVFTPDHLDVQARLYPTGDPATAWGDVPNGEPVALGDAGATGDGPYTAQTRTGDPCHAVEAATPVTTEFVLDTTAPAITVTSPAPEGVEFDTDDLSAITWTADDGADGSGVASTSATFDGAPATQGQQIDTFLLGPGVHTVTVTATDNLGNTDTVTRTFRVRATSASLLSNVDRAWAEGLITNRGAYNGMRATLEAAVRSHEAGRHRPELHQLGAVQNQAEAKLDKGIDPVFGARFIAYLEDLIANH